MIFAGCSDSDFLKYLIWDQIWKKKQHRYLSSGVVCWLRAVERDNSQSHKCLTVPISPKMSLLLPILNGNIIPQLTSCVDLFWVPPGFVLSQHMQAYGVCTSWSAFTSECWAPCESWVCDTVAVQLWKLIWISRSVFPPTSFCEADESICFAVFPCSFEAEGRARLHLPLALTASVSPLHCFQAGSSSSFIFMPQADQSLKPK